MRPHTNLLVRTTGGPVGRLDIHLVVAKHPRDSNSVCKGYCAYPISSTGNMPDMRQKSMPCSWIEYGGLRGDQYSINIWDYGRQSLIFPMAPGRRRIGSRLLLAIYPCRHIL